MSAEFSIGVWGKVVADPRNEGLSFTKIERGNVAGFLILTVEDGAHYDVWVETEDEVREFVSALEIDWDSGQIPFLEG